MRQPRVGINLMLERDEPAYVETDEYADKVRERMQTAYKLVQERLKATFDRTKRRYDQRVKEVRFKLGEQCWF
jgi:predicted transcriptional regulator